MFQIYILLKDKINWESQFTVSNGYLFTSYKLDVSKSQASEHLDVSMVNVGWDSEGGPFTLSVWEVRQV